VPDRHVYQADHKYEAEGRNKSAQNEATRRAE